MPRPKGSPKTEGSGRKKGTQNRVTLDIREAAQKFGAEAVATLVDLMRNADFETVRVAAAKELLDRAYGKAVQAVQAEVAERIIEYREEFDVPFMWFRLYYPGMDPELALETVRLFGEEVIPLCRAGAKTVHEVATP